MVVPNNLFSGANGELVRYDAPFPVVSSVRIQRERPKRLKSGGRSDLPLGALWEHPKRALPCAMKKILVRRENTIKMNFFLMRPQHPVHQVFGAGDHLVLRPWRQFNERTLAESFPGSFSPKSVDSPVDKWRDRPVLKYQISRASNLHKF